MRGEVVVTVGGVGTSTSPPLPPLAMDLMTKRWRLPPLLNTRVRGGGGVRSRAWGVFTACPPVRQQLERHTRAAMVWHARRVQQQKGKLEAGQHRRLAR